MYTSHAHTHACTHTQSHSSQSTSYSDTAPTGTLGGYTTSSVERSTDYDEDDEDGQLMLPDFDASQAYLSLGLTPLSQLSPDNNTANSNEFGFFPSMPPPVAPSSSLFSTSNSSLGMDSAFSLQSNGHSSSSVIDSSVMPDACPERRPRRSRHDLSVPLSQGFPLKLDPLPELSPPLEHQSSSDDHFSGKENGFGSSEGSQERSPFYSEPLGPVDFSRLSQGRTAMRRKGPTSRRDDPKDRLVHGRKAPEKNYGSFSVVKPEPDRMQALSPSMRAKLKRQQAKELEIAKVQEQQKKKQEEERQRQQKEEMLRDYSYSRNGTNLRRKLSSTGSTGHEPMANGNDGRSAVGDGMDIYGDYSSSQSPRRVTPNISSHSSLNNSAPQKLECSNSNVITTSEHITNL